MSSREEVEAPQAPSVADVHYAASLLNVSPSGLLAWVHAQHGGDLA